MHRGGRSLAFAILATLLVPAALSAACGPAAVCGDVAQSLYGGFIIDGVRLSWSTDDEDSTVAWYEVWRYDCANPQQCSVYVATKSATGECDTAEDYDQTDYPPGGAGDWTYVVEVWTTGNQRACAIDVVPE